MNKGVTFNIEEQPASMRFRYKREGPHGTLDGESSTSDWKTFPSIKIQNYTGIASVRVSCVTETEPHKSHPNDLLGDNCKEGVCYIKSFISEASSVLYFPRMSIERETLNGIKTKLKKRRSERIDPFGHGFKHIKELKKALQCVRLCFEVFITDPLNPKQEIRLLPKVTKPIYNIPAKFTHRIHNRNIPAEAEITIYYISRISSPKCGGEFIMMFCNRIFETDIKVRFFKENEENVIWENWGTWLYIHFNVGISFMTPIYEHRAQGRHIDVVENVFVQLVRPSDNMRSTAIPFLYIPSTSDQSFQHQPFQHQSVQHQSVQHQSVQGQHQPFQHRPVQCQPQQRQQQLPQPIQHQPVQYQPVEYQPVEYQPVEYQPVEYQPVEYQPVQYQSIQNQSVQNQSVQNQPFQNQPFQNLSVQHQSVQHQSVQNQSVQNQPFQHQSVQNQPYQNLSVQHQPVQNYPFQNQQFQNQQFQNQSVQNQPFQNLSVQHQPVQNQPFQKQSVQNQSVQNKYEITENNELFFDKNQLFFENNKFIATATYLKNILDFDSDSTMGEMLKLPLLANGFKREQ